MNLDVDLRWDKHQLPVLGLSLDAMGASREFGSPLPAKSGGAKEK